MSDQDIPESERQRRKYVKTGNPRDNLWKRICEQHGIKNYRKDSPDYAKARALYEEALVAKKKGLPQLLRT